MNAVALATPEHRPEALVPVPVADPPAPHNDLLLAWQRSAGNAAVARVLDRPATSRPAVLARRRCSCGGEIPEGREECDECRREREGTESALARSALERRLARAGVLARAEVCDADGVCTDPAVEEPVTSDPGAVSSELEPVAGDPGPVSSEPLASDPGPMLSEPVANDPGPVTSEPVSGDPGPMSSEPVEGDTGPISSEPEPAVCEVPPGAVGADVMQRAVPAASFVAPDATYAFAFVQGSRYVAPKVEALLADSTLSARGVAAARGLVTAESLAVGGSGVAEGTTLAETLAAAGETLLVAEAGGAGEVEAAAGPPGWVIGAIVLVAAGGLLVTGYLLSDRPQSAAPAPPATPPPPPTPAPPQTATPPATSAPPVATPAPAKRKYPNQKCEDPERETRHKEMHAICDAGWSCSDETERKKTGATTRKEHAKRLAAGGGFTCAELLANIAQGEACLKARQDFQKDCFFGPPDADHLRALQSVTDGIATCKAKAAARGC